MTRLAIVAALMAPLTTATAAQAADAPAEIKLGTLYASSGRFASISMPVHDGLKLWIDQKNADGGVYVKAFDKKIPLRLVAYDDQSSTATAATLYNQLITQDKVDILIADSGSVLTSVAVPIARDHKMLLIDQTGTGANFFTSDNPYIALMADPVSSVWPKPLADFLTHDGPGLGIKRVAMLYATNDFTGTQATTIRKLIKESNSGVELVFDEGVPTETSNYTVLLNNIRASNSDAVLHLGYASNDIAFLRNVQDSGIKFKFLFSIYPGVETELLEKNLGSKPLDYLFTYVTALDQDYKSEFGMSLKQYQQYVYEVQQHRGSAHSRGCVQSRFDLRRRCRVAWTVDAPHPPRYGVADHSGDSAAVVAAVSPMAYFDQFSRWPRKSLIIYAKYDLTFLPELSRNVVEEFERHGLNHKVVVLPCGHYTMGETPYKYMDGWQLASFLRTAFV